jgi:hypothetical protein
VQTVKRRVLTVRHCGGLFNQYAGTIDALALAAQLGRTLVLPRSMSRRVMARGEAGEWTSMPFDALFDSAYLRRALPDIRIEDETAIERYPPEASGVVHVPKVQAQARDYFRGVVGDAAHAHIICPQFAYAPTTLGEVALKRRIEAALRFNTTVLADAMQVVRRLKAASAHHSYNGFHFRCEADAKDAWALDCAAPSVNSYPLTSGHLDHRRPLYVATGDPASTAHIDAAYRTLTHRDFGNFTERYRGHLEQTAALDALVMVHADAFVGFSVSSFSYFCARLRPPQRSSVLMRFRAGDRTIGVFERTFPPFGAASLSERDLAKAPPARRAGPETHK